MNNKASRILYFVLFYLGWVGILWTAYAFCLSTYNEIMGIATEETSFFILLFILLCVSLMSIATADFMFGQKSQTKETSKST